MLLRVEEFWEESIMYILYEIYVWKHHTRILSNTLLVSVEDRKTQRSYNKFTVIQV